MRRTVRGRTTCVCLRNFAALHTLWINLKRNITPDDHSEHSIQICENTTAGRCTAGLFTYSLLKCVVYPLMRGRKLWTCFSGSARFYRYSVEHCNFSVNEPIQCVRASEYVDGTVNALVRHIVYAESRRKVIRLMTFAAHNSFMELHAVDLDRNQSGSMELDMESSVHY